MHPIDLPDGYIARPSTPDDLEPTFRLVAAAEEIIQDLLPLGIPNALQDHLLGRLSRNPSRICRGCLNHDRLPKLYIRLHPARLCQRDLGARVGHPLHDGLFRPDLYLPCRLADLDRNVLSRQKSVLAVR